MGGITFDEKLNRIWMSDEKRIREMEFSILRSDKVSVESKKRILLKYPEGCHCFALNEYGLLYCRVCKPGPYDDGTLCNPFRKNPYTGKSPHSPMYDPEHRFYINGLKQDEILKTQKKD